MKKLRWLLYPFLSFIEIVLFIITIIAVFITVVIEKIIRKLPSIDWYRGDKYEEF